MTQGTWLRGVRAKEKAQGVDHMQLACYASKLTPHVRDHLSRAAQEIEKLYGQLPSATVFETQQRKHWETEREAYIESIRSVLGHLASALTAVGCTDEQLALGEPDAGTTADRKEAPESPDGAQEKPEKGESEAEKTQKIPVPVTAAVSLARGKK